MSSSPAAARRVPLVLHVIPTAVARGAQREARALADRLSLPGVRDHRLMSLFAGPEGVPVDEALAVAGGPQGSRGYAPRVVLPLRRKLAELRPAAVVAHGGDPLKYLVAAMAGRRVPLAYYATGTFGAAGRRVRTTLWRALVRRPDVVAAEGEEVFAECRDLLRVPPERLVLAPNGRDPAQFRPADGPPRRRPVLSFVGALTTGKRPDRFVEAVAGLRRRGLDLDAVVCGDGPLAPSLRAPADAAGVELLGSRADVADVLRSVDVLVFPSVPTGEGMPGVLIEAGLSGLPVVATAVPGVRSVVEDGTTGFVVGPDDMEAMTEALARLVADPLLRRTMGAAARRRCLDRFTLDQVVANWSSFLSPLVERAPASGRTGPGGPPAPGG